MWSLVTEKTADAHRLTADGFHGAKKRRLFVQSLAGIAAERSGDAERFGVAVIVEERGAGDIPNRIAAGLKRGAYAAGGKGRGIRLAVNELLAAQLHDDAAVMLRADKGVVLLGGSAGQRLEPVRVMGGALFDCPRLHRGRRRVRNAGVEFLAGRHAGLQALINGSGQTLAHLLLAEDVLPYKVGISRYSLMRLLLDLCIFPALSSAR